VQVVLVLGLAPLVITELILYLAISLLLAAVGVGGLTLLLTLVVVAALAAEPHIQLFRLFMQVVLAYLDKVMLAEVIPLLRALGLRLEVVALEQLV
jgi:hypothetical protein